MIAVFTGNGKGKTTSCIGHMVRARGSGKQAIMFQFIKGPWKSGEHNSDLRIVRGGKGFVRILGDKLPLAQHRQEARRTFMQAQKAVSSKKWDMVVLDEINVAIHSKLLGVMDVVRFLKKVPSKKIVILSGRYAHPRIMAVADLVTEMRQIKHPYEKGILAQRGFDY